MSSKFKKFSPILSGTWVPENLSENKKKINKTYNIFVNDLVLNTFIGIHDHEKIKRQKISISLILKAFDNFKKSDDAIENVVSYENIVNDIESLARSGHIGLLETLSEQVAQICFKDSRILSATIKIEKLEVFKKAKSVGIEIFREKTKNNPSKKVGKIFKIKK